METNDPKSDFNAYSRHSQATRYRSGASGASFAEPETAPAPEEGRTAYRPNLNEMSGKRIKHARWRLRILRALAGLACVGVIAFAVCTIVGVGPLAGILSIPDDAVIISLESTSTTETEKETVEYSFAVAQLDEVKAEDAVTPFSVSSLEPLELSEAMGSALSDALKAVKEKGETGFIFLNLQTGRGIAYNTDQTVFADAAIMAPYAAYVGKLFDAGTAKQSEYKQLLSDAVLKTDRNAFASLRQGLDALGWDEWAAAAGVPEAKATSGSYASLNARGLMKLWGATMAYMNSKAGCAAWVSDLLAKTETDFIRDALSSKGAGAKAKPGMFATTNKDAYSICDGGVVTAGESTYLLCIVSSMNYDEENTARFKGLVQAIFDARSTLDLKLKTIETVTSAKGTTTTKVTTEE